MTVLRNMLVLAGAVALSACAASQQKADQALQEADSAIRAQHADATLFAPEAFAEVGKTSMAAKAAYDAKDWKTAIEKAGETVTQAQQLQTAIEAGKAKAQAEWPATRDSLGAMLTGLRDRLDEAQRTRKYPEGMKAADVQAKRNRVDSLTAGLEKAGAEFDKGDLQGATHAADRIRTEAGRLMMELGLMPKNPHGM